VHVSQKPRAPTRVAAVRLKRKGILPLPLACSAPRWSAVLLCSSWSSICCIQHPSQLQILKPAFGFQKRTPTLGTHFGTNSWCQNEARFLGFVLDPPGRLKIRAPNHVAANQVSTHYAIENMQSVACLTWLQIKPF
jgi:hypothetical protein